MNHYYAEFHARDRIEQLHREAVGSQRASQSPGRRGDRSTNRVTSKSLMAVLFLFAAILVGLLLALPANAEGAFTDRIENIDSVLAVALAPAVLSDARAGGSDS